jgi:hypothetical protein
MSVKTHIYFYCLHRYDLVFYVRIIEYLRSVNFLIKATAIIDSKLFEHEVVKLYVKINFDNVLLIPFENCEEKKIYERCVAFIRLRRWIRDQLDPSSFMVLLDKSNLLSRVFLKQHKRNILIQGIETIGVGFKFSYIHFLKELLRFSITGSMLMKHYFNSSSGGRIQALSFFNFNKPKNIIYITDDINKKPNISLPVLPIKKGKKVIIFGSRFLSWNDFSDDPYPDKSKKIFIKKVLLVYRYLARSLSGDFRLYYIPHPLEQDGEFDLLSDIFSQRLTRVSNFISGEEFLLRNRDVALTISLGSTLSNSAFSMGFNSKVFYKMLGLKQSISSVYDDIFFGLPPDFFAKEYVDLLKPCYRVDRDGNMSDFISMLKVYD